MMHSSKRSKEKEQAFDAFFRVLQSCARRQSFGSISKESLKNSLNAVIDDRIRQFFGGDGK
jgi:hypothetical protein